MPIYEYKSVHPSQACPRCRTPFEIIQRHDEKPIETCPDCGERVKKLISLCHPVVLETPDENIRTERDIKAYEKAGMWSHAAELADTHSEKTKDKGLKLRALDNYKKAGYDADFLAKHAKTSDD